MAFYLTFLGKMARLLLLIQWADAKPTSKGRLRHPGTMFVCQGNRASLLWQALGEPETFDSFLVNKMAPDKGFVAGMGKAPSGSTGSERFRLVQGAEIGVVIDDAQLSDAGTYRMQVFVDGTKPSAGDEVVLTVIDKSDCPDPQRYRPPRISLKFGPGTPRIPISSAANKIDVAQLANASVVVTLPRAKPPVTCTVTIGNSNHSCEGRADADTECETEMGMDAEERQKVTVTLTYIALDPSVTTLTILQGNVTEELVIVSEQEAVSDADPTEVAHVQEVSETSTVIWLWPLVAVLAVVAVGSLLTLVVYFLRSKAAASKPSDHTTDSGEKRSSKPHVYQALLRAEPQNTVPKSGAETEAPYSEPYALPADAMYEEIPDAPAAAQIPNYYNMAGDRHAGRPPGAECGHYYQDTLNARKQ